MVQSLRVGDQTWTRTEALSEYPGIGCSAAAPFWSQNSIKKWPALRCGAARVSGKRRHKRAAGERLRPCNGAFAHAFGPDYHLLGCSRSSMASTPSAASWRRTPAASACRRFPARCARERKPISSASTRPSPASASSCSSSSASAFLDGGDRLRDRRHPVRRRRLHRHERLGARQRAHRAGGDEIARRRPRHRLPLGRGDRPACGWPRASRRRRLFRRADRTFSAIRRRTARRSTRWSRSASALRSSRSSPGSAAASSPRAPTSAPTSSARSRPAFRRTIRAIRRPSPTMSAIMSAIAPAWPPTCSRPMW